jgi:hypothetical protein
MRKITDEFVDSVNAELWQEGVDKYGSKFSLPKDLEKEINETIRALYVLQIWQRNGSSGNPLSQLSAYSVSENVAQNVVAQYLGDKYIKQLEKEKSEKTEKRKDKWDSFIEWANENQGKEFTTEQLEKQSGFSYQTTLTYVKTSPVFEKVKKGKYRVIPIDDRVRKK